MSSENVCIICEKHNRKCEHNKMQTDSIGQVEAEVINTPEKFAPVLADITKNGELGNQGWWEVVYHDGVNWQHFAGSNTFDDGEKVVKWKLCRECL
jgi:hypothetical protein